jgi:Tfp pilus assembly protein PilX
MVIMKTLSNNKGISLVILIVVMTLIAILGASFVSLMGSKQKGFLYQIDSYRALNIANAGVEYAIRYVSDGLSDTSSGYYSNLPTQSIGNTPFANGSFSIIRNYDLSNIANDYIEVTGSFKSASRKVKLSKFRRYLNPITLIPNAAQKPSIAGFQLTVQVIGNNSTDITVSQIDITLPAGRHLQRIERINSIDTITVFDYTDLSTQAYYAGDPRFSPAQGLLMTGTTSLIPSGLSSHSVHFDDLNVYIIQFATAPPAGQYTIKFYPAPFSEIKFVP